MKKVLLVVCSILLLTGFACAEPLTPRQIESVILDRVYPSGSCVQMAKDAKELAEENGYVAVYRQNQSHRWLVIYTKEQYLARKCGVDIQPVEILKANDILRDMRRRIK